MKWTYSIRNKMTAAILLAIILGLTMLTNLVERKRFRQLEKSFSSIYEDRLMAESYLFHMYENLKNNQDLIQVAAKEGLNATNRANLEEYRIQRDNLLEKYRQTYLTPDESEKFQKLETIIIEVDQLEQQLTNKTGSSEVPTAIIDRNNEISSEAFATLSTLSDIQTAEGAVLRNKCNKIISGSVSFSRLQMSVLVVIAIIIQALIFSSYTLFKTKPPKNPSLN